MADHNDPPESAGKPSDDLAALKRKLDAARPERAPDAGGSSGNASSVAARFAGEFGASVIVGGLVGYGVDFWLHSGPWGLIIGLGLGFVAGVVNVVRAAQAYARANPVDPNTPSIPDDDEEK